MIKTVIQKILYLEPGLSHAEGHLLETLKVLHPYFQRYGNIEVYGNRSVSPEMAQKEKINPHFSPRKEMPLITFLRNKRFLWRLCNPLTFLNRRYLIHQAYRDLKSILKKNDDSTMIFYPTPNSYELLAAFRLIRRYGQSEKWAFILRVLPGIHELPLLMKEFQNMEKIRERMVFFSDSELMIREYEKLGLHNIKLLPIPHMPKYREKPDGKPLTLAYLGPVREEKGFDLLPDVIQYLEHRNSNLEYFIQASGFSVMWTLWEQKIMKSVLDKLESLAKSSSNITICRKHLESGEYYTRLNHCDIILLPYKMRDKRYYATSGILAEAMALGKVAVVPADTWLAQQIKRSGGGVIFNTPEELPQKVEEAICNFDCLHQKAVDYVPVWRKFHNTENFIKILMENC